MSNNQLQHISEWGCGEGAESLEELLDAGAGGFGSSILPIF